MSEYFHTCLNISDENNKGNFGISLGPIDLTKLIKGETDYRKKTIINNFFITTLSLNIFASDLDQKLASFLPSKVKKYKVYRKNFVKWMDKREKRIKGNKGLLSNI